jgi:antitoxin VapB
MYIQRTTGTMPLQIRDPRAHDLAAELASRMQRKVGKARKVTLTDAVIQALEDALNRDEAATPVLDRVRVLQERIAAFQKTGGVADKAFFDDLSGDQ